MLERFVCPDGGEIDIRDCLKDGGCRLTKRCLTKATLIELGKVRSWKGVPSTTQLLNGTNEAFLKITMPYAETPDSMAFRLLGTMSHSMLESNDVEGSIIEERLTGQDGVSGQADILETEGGWNVLTDYKNSGSFKVAKALGAYPVWKDHPTEVYQKKTTLTINGVKETREKGDPKVIKTMQFDIKRQDCRDWVLQLNKYRIDLEDALGIHVDEMRIQVTVRDGGTLSARTFGIDRRIYMVPIPHLPDHEVTDYFKRKKHALLTALEQGDWDVPCDVEETWNGRKCQINEDGQSFCSVRKYCKFMQNADPQEPESGSCED